MSAEKVIKLKIDIFKYTSGFSGDIAPITVLTVHGDRPGSAFGLAFTPRPLNAPITTPSLLASLSY